MSYETKVYKDEGGDKLVVASGGVLDIESGGAFKIAGVQVTASAADLNVAGGGSTGTTNQTFTVDSDGTAGTLELKGGTDSGNHKTTLQLGTTSGAVTLTLPASSGTIALTTDTAVDIDAGDATHAGSLDVFSGAGTSRKLIISCADTGADSRTVTLTNASVAASRAYTLPDAGADGKVVIQTGGGVGTIACANAVTITGNGAGSAVTLPASGTLLADGGTSGLTDTTNSTFTVDSDCATGKLQLKNTTGGTNHTVILQTTAPAGGDITLTLPGTSGTLALATGAETGTTNSSFTVDNDSANAKIALDTNSATGNFTLSLVPANLSANRTVTFQDAAAQTVVARDTTDTLTNKTLTTPVINGCTTAAAVGNFVLNTSTGAFTTPQGAFTFYGNVANNGNITFDFSGSNGTFKTSTGTNTLGGNVVINGSSTLITGTGAATLKGSATFDATKTLTFGSAAGGTANVVTMYTPTGSKGAFILSPTDNATDHTVTLTNGAVNGGAATITLPNATCTLSGLGLAESFSGVKTFTAAPLVAVDDASNNAVTDLLTLKHTTSGDPSAGMGVGIGVTIENDTDATTEVANLDFVMSNDGTKAALDVDVVLNTMVAGASTQVFNFDADEGGAGGAKLWQFGSDANAVVVELHPPTTASGTLRLVAADNAGDTILTVTHESQTQATTFKIPDLNVAAAQFVCINSDHTLALTVGADTSLNVLGTVGVRGGAAPVEGGVVAIKFDMDNTAGSSTWTNGTGRTLHIVSMRIVKTDGAGTAGDSVRMFNGASAITDDHSLDGVSDTALTTFATIDDTKNSIANAGTLVCTTTDAGDHCECEVTVIGLLV